MIFGLAIGVGCILLALWAVAFFFPQQVLTVDSGDAKADAIVLLGGGGDGRAERAAELYHQGAAPKVLVTGYGDSGYNVDNLKRHGVPLTDIVEEPNALSTLQNAQYSLPLLKKMGAHRVIIVTSWYHSRRALACFKHFEKNMTFFSRPTYVGYKPRDWKHDLINSPQNIEYVKIPVYLFAYGVWPL